MLEDLSAPYPGFGWVHWIPSRLRSYRLLDETALADEIAQMKDIIEQNYRSLVISQDLGLA